MASTSHPHHTHKVFLSFRDKDTGHNFTDHLYKALTGAGLHTFRDNDETERDQELEPKIEMAIVKSRASIVVLSKNYAKSKMRLNELLLILEQRRKCDHFVLPVFYHVDPSDVRNQRGSFAIKRSRTVDDVRRWKAALTEVADLTGMVLSGSETDFIKKVVETFICTSTRVRSARMETQVEPFSSSSRSEAECSTPLHLVGMVTQAGPFNSWLKNEQSNVISIFGMGGAGKTTLAKYIFNLHRKDFESSSFVEDIQHSKHDLLGLQNQILQDLLGGKKIKISNVSEGTRKIEEILQMRKVLIVLDDIDDQDTLDILLGRNALPKKSKLIITTRRRDIDRWFGSISWRCMLHEIKFLNDLESLEFFSLHAFGSKIPMEGFEDLSKQVVQYCGGNALALEVLGSSLFISDDYEHERNSMIEIWRSRINSLNSSKGDLDSRIRVVLRKSFDSLQLRYYKELFLDIAAFFVGESKDMVTILRDGVYVKSGIETLIDRALISVSPAGELMMHQLLQHLARQIVREESKNPIKRSRVWNDEESYHVLTKGDVSDTIEGLALDMRNIEQGMRPKALPLKTSSLAKMNKLKLLQLKYVKLTGSYKDFPDLRWLCWHGCPLDTMPPGLLKSSLVAIDMSYGHIEMFEAPTVLDSLKILNLQECDKLVSIRKLYRFPKLETLILAHCRNLTHLCDSIGDLKSLTLLNLKGCIKLSKASNVISSRIDGGNLVQPLFCLPSSLKFLYLNYCQIEYKNDVRVSFQAQSFFDLCLERNPFKSLPTSIDLKMLKTLNLYACFLLKSLPCIPSTLEELYIDRCSSLKKISFKSGRFNLQQFSYKDCFELSEVQGLFKLLPVAQIDEADLVQHMQWIKEYEDRRMYLVGDEITNGRFRPIQMLYEYGIMSTYLQGINDQIMMTSEYTSSFGFLSFRVPFHHKENRIKGLYVSCLYRSSGSNGIDRSCLWVKISNKSKGLTWVYNPVVYSKPCVDEDVLWLSYWPIGNTLDVGDVVHVEIIVDEGVMTVSECGASVVYIDDEEEEEENYKSNTMKREEVIGGDLTEFEVTTGGYYLCRRDLFGSETSSWLNWWFDLDIHYPELQGWKKTRELTMRTSISDMMRYDIFLSFRGKDTRHSFTDHLYHALIRAGLYTFRDDDAIPRGQVLKPEIETAIKESRVFIVVLSMNYANSRWCMDELCLILEQRRHYNRFVLPVFYHVDPSDVGNQTGSFAIEGSKRTEDKVRWWKEALTEVATLKGMVLSGSRSEAGLIKKVVDTIYYKV